MDNPSHSIVCILWMVNYGFWTSHFLLDVHTEANSKAHNIAKDTVANFLSHSDRQIAPFQINEN